MEFNTINDLIRGLNIDFKYWENKEALRFNKLGAVDKTDVYLEHVPENLLEIKVNCKYGHSFKPEWLKKVTPASVFRIGPNELLRQSSTNIKCPICDIDVAFNLPQAKYKKDIDIFGDEAFRQIDNKNISVYSFVSFSGNKHNEKLFKEEIDRVKKVMAPSINPDDWTIHMTELYSKEKRVRKNYLRHHTQDSIHKCIKEILKIIKCFTNDKHLNTWVAVSLAKGKKLSKDERLYTLRSTYASALTRVIDENTKSGFSPKIYFERTGSDGWAKNLFDGFRLTLLWPYMTNGLPVMTPKFIEPHESIYLELADIISYITARHLFCIGKRASGKSVECEFNTKNLGIIRYIITQKDTDWLYLNSVGFPDKETFMGTAWASHTKKYKPRK